MNKHLLVFILILFIKCRKPPDIGASKLKASAMAVPIRKTFDYCFSKNDSYFVKNVGDTGAITVKLSVTDVKLSPDGTNLAYTDQNSPDKVRRIGMMDLTTQKTSILDSACRNCYGPVWSPDGKWLAYNAMDSGKWNIKYINLGTGKAEFIKLHGSASGNFSPQWSADSKNIIVQDMVHVYIIGLTNNILRHTFLRSYNPRLARVSKN
jgi:Tol biopolymer transport system component